MYLVPGVICSVQFGQQLSLAFEQDKVNTGRNRKKHTAWQQSVQFLAPYCGSGLKFQSRSPDQNQQSEQAAAATAMPVVLYKWGGHSGLPSLTAASLQAEVRHSDHRSSSSSTSTTTTTTAAAAAADTGGQHQERQASHTASPSLLPLCPGLPAVRQGGFLRAGVQLSQQLAHRCGARRGRGRPQPMNSQQQPVRQDEMKGVCRALAQAQLSISADSTRQPLPHTRRTHPTAAVPVVLIL